jgi:hypothetical protein
VFRPLHPLVTHIHPTFATSTELTLKTITPRAIFPMNLKLKLNGDRGDGNGVEGGPRSLGMCTHVFISLILHAVNVGGTVYKTTICCGSIREKAFTNVM